MATKQCPYCAEPIQEDAIKCKHCNTWLATPPGEKVAGPPLDEVVHPEGTGLTAPRRLTRSTTDRMMAGVLGGIAEYLNMDPTLVRILYVVLSIFTVAFPGLTLYIILWIIIPRDIDVKN